MGALGAFVFGFIGALAGTAVAQANAGSPGRTLVYAGLGGSIGGGLGALL